MSLYWTRYVATLGIIGYVEASGTVATIVTLPLVNLMQTMLKTQELYALVTVLLLCVGWWCIREAMHVLRRYDDPSEIVLDEVIGCLIAFCGIPFTATNVMLGLLIFRFMDIIKIPGVSHAELVGGATGVMLDDVVAGIMTNILLRFLL